MISMTSVCVSPTYTVIFQFVTVACIHTLHWFNCQFQKNSIDIDSVETKHVRPYRVPKIQKRKPIFTKKRKTKQNSKNSSNSVLVVRVYVCMLCKLNPYQVIFNILKLNLHQKNTRNVAINFRHIRSLACVYCFH